MNNNKSVFKILFVCHGNICRSPMAEFVMKDIVEKAGQGSRFLIESAAVSSEEIGNPVYPPVKRLLNSHNISCEGKYARKMTRADYDAFDLIVAMDSDNLRRIASICGVDTEKKVYLLKSFVGVSGDVADPWYTGNFTQTWNDVYAGCSAIFAKFTDSAK